MKKSIAGLIVLVVLLGAMLTTIIVNRKYIFTKDKIYTQKEVDSMSAKISEEARIKYADDTLLDRIDSLSVQRIKLLAEVEQLKTEQEQYLNSIANYEKSVSDLNNQIKLCEAEKQNLSSQIESNNQTISDLNLQKSNLESQVINLQNENNLKSEQITSLNNQIKLCEAEKQNLSSQIESNNQTISDLNLQKSNLESQVVNLQNENNLKSEQITSLNNQINDLQQNVRQLQTTNQINSETITRLNNQISDLSNQVVELTLSLQNSATLINNSNSRINELEKTVTYYESYIATLENGEQVVATFEFDGSVYNIQIVNKGSKLSVTTPTSTDYIIFNGWTVNGSAIDLDTYTITTNTKIVADITYKFDVKFKVDDEFIESQIIEKDSYATPPADPTKEGYDFIGWSINGIDVVSNIDTISVTQNTTYIALFKKLYNVTFMVDDEVYRTFVLRENANLPNILPLRKVGFKFVGWSINGKDVVDSKNYKIIKDVTLIALFTYDYNGQYRINIDTTSSGSVEFKGVFNFYVHDGNPSTYVFKPDSENISVSNWKAFSSKTSNTCSITFDFTLTKKVGGFVTGKTDVSIRFDLSENNTDVYITKGGFTLKSFEVTRS